MKRLAVVLLVLSTGPACACYTVQPGNRGVKVTLGQVSETILPEGFGTKPPWSTVELVSIRQQTRGLNATCFSSDLQQVNLQLKVLYRIPETSVIKVFRDYAGDPFDSMVAPRVQEALKEVTAGLSAEQIVKQRETVKSTAVDLARKKLGEILRIEDVVIENIDLSEELEKAIEAKMVQEQEAAKAKFRQQQAEIDAQTMVVKAKGEAESIRIRGDALKSNPAFIDLQIVEKWNGVSPLVAGSAQGAHVLMPMPGTATAARGTP